MGRNNRGMSIAQVLVVAAMGAAVLAAIGSGMNSLMKATKSVDVKGQAQSFGTALRLAVSDPTKCASVLGLGSGLSVSTALLPATAGTTYLMPVTNMVVAGSTYAPGSVMQDIGISTISLNIMPRISSTYPATLLVGITSRVANGAPLVLSQSANLELSISTSGQVQSCSSNSVSDPSATCTTLGGRWLDGPYMGTDGANARCNMTPEISLGVNEWPDGIPSDGFTNSTTGERVEICKYQNNNSTVISRYNCPSRGVGKAGYACVFDTTQRRWAVKYFNTNGSIRSTRFYCVKGVQISSISPDTELLDYNEDLSVAYHASTTYTSSGTVTAGNVAASHFDYLDRLSTVSRCLYSPTSDFWYNCKNTTDLDSALQGKASSCIYVYGVKTYGLAANVSYNGATIDKNNYTGWMYVRIPRANFNTVTSPYNYLREARGLPCYQVEVNTVSETTDFDTVPTSAAPDPTPVAIETPTDVTACLFVAPASEKLSTPTTAYGSVAGAPSHRLNVLRCDNSDMLTSPGTVGDNTAAFAWVGYGTGSGLKPLLTKGSCWYFDNVKTPFKGYPTYTGWMYLTSDLPDNKFVPVNGSANPTTGAMITTGDNYKIKAMAPANVVPGIPCTGGIRSNGP